MIKSMTGFGRGEHMKENKKFTVEVKTVNHRYGDFNIKMTKKFSFLESEVKNLLKKYISRGKIDVYISYEDQSEESSSVKVNGPLLKEYKDKLGLIGEEYGIKNDLNLSILSRFPEVLKLEEQKYDEELIWEVLSTAITQAVENVIAMRKKEGASLVLDLNTKLDHMQELTKQIEERSPLVVTEYRERLNSRLQELLSDNTVDENRIAQEVAVFADRCAIDEELVRLESHIKQVRSTLQAKGSVGRKLDFLAQEMNREANTIGSKANDLQITGFAIELKAEIEKIREQIQNIE